MLTMTVLTVSLLNIRGLWEGYVFPEPATKSYSDTKALLDLHLTCVCVYISTIIVHLGV